MEVDDIDEEINQDDLDVNDLLQNNDGYGTSWSKQSLGIDKSVDSLALDRFDHIEYIQK